MDLMDILEGIGEIIMIFIFLVALISLALFGIWLGDIIFSPSDTEVQCTTIEGAKWSGESCYKNGIKINFSEGNLL